MGLYLSLRFLSIWSFFLPVSVNLFPFYVLFPFFCFHIFLRLLFWEFHWPNHTFSSYDWITIPCNYFRIRNFISSGFFYSSGKIKFLVDRTSTLSRHMTESRFLVTTLEFEISFLQGSFTVLVKLSFWWTVPPHFLVIWLNHDSL